jgi:DNA-binding transcriptional MerR regulator
VSAARKKSAGEREKLYRPRDVLERAGISRQVLYQYSTMGLIEEARTTRSGHRLYDEDVFVRLRIIKHLNETGYTLRDIKDIFFKQKTKRKAGS